MQAVTKPVNKGVDTDVKASKDQAKPSDSKITAKPPTVKREKSDIFKSFSKQNSQLKREESKKVTKEKASYPI